ncbi:MAG: Ig-like domain-containing protein [Clostridia bacterium]|nr:Ig-like domain-containing protein [Clostridia bacterium]
MLKKLTLFILSVIVILCCCVAVFSASAADDTMEKLNSLVRQFPEDKYWNHMGSDENNPDGWTDEPCASHRNCSFFPGECSCNSFDNAIQCMGYAYKIAYEITGVSARDFTKVKNLKAANLRVGDIIRYSGHSICVTGVNGNRISFTDNNYTGLCQIRWGQMDISSIKSFTYVLHLEGNNRKNTNLDFYESVEPDTESEQNTPKEIWKMSDEDFLNIRKSASTTAKKVGSVPASARFNVYEKKLSDEYLWGKVEYNGVSGWAALNYSEYLSGSYEKPEFIDSQEKYEALEQTFTWSKVSGADKYRLTLYDKDKKPIDDYEASGTEYKLTIPADGVYYIKVTALNSFCESWKIGSDMLKFTAEKYNGEVKEIKLSASSQSLDKGGEFTLTAEVLPEKALDKTVTWKSDKPEVATVSENGVVTAVSYGKADISCFSADGKITAKCTVTVIPDNVTSLKQAVGKTTTSALLLKWNKVPDADGYYVKRYDSAKKKYVSVGTCATGSFADKTVKAGKSYTYIVSAFVKTDSGEVESTGVKVKCSTDPAKVTGLRQSASSSGTVTIKWNKTANATSYVVYKYNSKTKKYVKFKTVKKNSLKIKQNAASSVKYRVRAVTATEWGNNYGANSTVVTATSGPKKVTAKLTNAGKGKIKISWSKVSGATHYEIYRLQSGKYKKIATVGSKYGSFTNINLKSGRKYQYRVRAIKVKGNVTAYGSYCSKMTLKAK